MRLWDPATGKTTRELLRHAGCALVVAFAPDGKTVASGGEDAKVRLWDPATGKHLRECAGHTNLVTALAFAPDGKTVYSGSHDGTIRQWDVAGGKELRRWDGGGGWARTLALSPDGRTLAVANENGTARLWEVATLQVRRFFKTDDGYTWAVAFAPDGRAVATAGDDRTVRLWDVTGLAGRTKPPAPTADELEALWADLGGPDAPRAYTAVWALAAAPKESLPFLAKRLRPEKVPEVDDKRIARLIADLDDESFEVREKASRELEERWRQAERAARKALADGKLSAEQRLRIGRLIEKVGGPSLPPEELRALRGVEALERLGRPDGLRLLEELAKGPADAPLTREAKAAVERLAGRGKGVP